MNVENINNKNYISEIKEILNSAKKQVYTAVNSAMVQAYWLIGKRIVEEEQNGKERADYGKFIIENLSIELTSEFGKGFSVRSIREYRQFYLTFNDKAIQRTLFAESLNKNNVIRHSLSAELNKSKRPTMWSRLSWSHYRLIMRVSNIEAREYYIKETAENHWSVRTLDRNIATQYYERLFLSHNKDEVKKEMQEKTKEFKLDKNEFLKSPAILEFLNIPANKGYTENQLENAIINNLHNFLLELGKGYAFVERQKLIRTGTRDYFIDLVFYNYMLKCFVLIDLKTERITHQHVGQMDMYVRMYDEKIKSDDDNPSIGIVLCSETDGAIARYSILKGNEQLFASKYKLYLPTEDELKNEIEQEKLNFKLQNENNDEL